MDAFRDYLVASKLIIFLKNERELCEKIEGGVPIITSEYDTFFKICKNDLQDMQKRMEFGFCIQTLRRYIAWNLIFKLFKPLQNSLRMKKEYEYDNAYYEDYFGNNLSVAIYRLYNYLSLLGRSEKFDESILYDKKKRKHAMKRLKRRGWVLA